MNVLPSGLSHMLERWRLRRLERRGDVVTGWSESLAFFLQLAEDLIPEKDCEIPRDLFGLLAYAWAAQAKRDRGYEPHRLLRAIRARAWFGYADTPGLVAMTRQELPRRAAMVRARLRGEGETGGSLAVQIV